MLPEREREHLLPFYAGKKLLLKVQQLLLILFGRPRSACQYFLFLAWQIKPGAVPVLLFTPRRIIGLLGGY
jgi:hypothetical protein